MNTLQVKINNDQSVSLISIPSDRSNFRDAVEVTSKPIVSISQLAIPSYDFSTTPVNITYSIVDLTIPEIQTQLITNIINILRSDIYILLNVDIDNLNVPFDGTTFAAAKSIAHEKINQVNAAVTLDELTAIVL